jgi:hypothetical protein
MKVKVNSQEDCLELCNLFTNLYFKISKFKDVPPALEKALWGNKDAQKKN